VKTETTMLLGGVLAILLATEVSAQDPGKRLIPPDAPTRRDAIGPLTGLAPVLKRAFTANEDSS
jgi:hypothetical protein